jgi:hypothetical protein
VNKLVGALTITTCIFAGSTLYLAYALNVEQERLRAARNSSAMDRLASGQGSGGGALTGHPGSALGHSADLDVTASPDAAAGWAVEAPDADSLAEAQADSAASAPGGGARAAGRDARVAARARARQRDAAARLLSQYEDPIGRERLMANARAAQRRSLDRFPQVAGLTDDETNRLVDLLAQQQVEARVKAAQCFVDEACTPPPRASASLDRKAITQQIADFLGPATAERYELYQGTLEERRSVTGLRARLPDNHVLAEADAERLIEVLARERQKYVGEIEQAGGRVRSLGAGGAGSIRYRQVEAGRGEGLRVTVDLESAVDFSERMRSAASQVLTDDQLRVFSEMQDDLLAVLRQRVRAQQMRPTNARSNVVESGRAAGK